MLKIKYVIFAVITLICLFGCLLGDDIDALRERAGSSSDPVYISPNIEMVWINSGSFVREGNTITLSGFYIGKYEVTQEQYEAVMGINPSSFSSYPADGEIQSRRPVECVSWYDAIEFCNKLSEQEGLTPVYIINGVMVSANWSNNGYRLPTEAQWEYACRAGTTTDWSFGNNESELANYAWYSQNSNSRTHQVGLKLPNAWGLYDMHGNVWELCWNWYGNYPAGSDPTGASSGTYRVARGGGWDYSAGSTRSANRGTSSPDNRGSDIGFRVVRPGYTVTYNANSATSGTVPVPQTTAYGTSITLPNAGNLERTGYTFGGWNTSLNGTGINYNAGASYTVNGNVTLYARWVVEVDGMVWINPGSFVREGSTITLSSGFYMGKYEVTQTQYQEVMGTNPSYYSSNPASEEEQSRRPVEQVSWYDAVEFCNALSVIDGLTPYYNINKAATDPNNINEYDPFKWLVTTNNSANGYRLPTEAQWEYACRAGTTTYWSFGDNENELDNYAWYYENSNGMTHQVGLKLPNAWGLYDMHGNVWEWCWDWYGSLPSTNQTDYKGGNSGFFRVERGGSWSYSAGGTHSAYRGAINPNGRVNGIGFRVVRS